MSIKRLIYQDYLYYLYMSTFFNTPSPLDQFEVRNLLSADAPILGNLSLSLTNVAFYLTIAGYLIFVISLLSTNENKEVKLFERDPRFPSLYNLYDPSSKNPIQLVLTCLKSDQGTYYLVDKYRVSAWLVLRVRCHLTYPAVTREYFKKDGITYDGLRVTDPD